MQTNYYPWNVQLLVNWLDEERPKYESLEALAQVLGIAVLSLREWKMYQSLSITLEQINALARYRGWDLMRTIQWLGIQKFHLQELIRAQPHRADELAEALGLERVTDNRRGLRELGFADSQDAPEQVEQRYSESLFFLRR